MKHVELELRPSPALLALTELGRALDDRWALGSAFVRAARSERDRLRAPLDVLAGCVEWLESQGHAAVVRPGPRKPRTTREPAYLVPVRIDLDVRALVRGVADEGRAPRGPWHVTAFALTSVLRALCERSLLVASVLRADRRPVDARVVLEAIEAALGTNAAPRVRVAKGKPAKARAKPRVATTRESPRVQPRTGNTVKEQRARSAAKEQRTAKQPPPRARRTAGAGFGGLPDDAEPEERAAGAHAAIGPRGISLDAEFFLEHAGVATWPCTSNELTAGRRRALAGLHPDRVGESGTQLFQRAVRGHAELVRRLEALGKSPPIAAPSAPVAPPPANDGGTRRSAPVRPAAHSGRVAATPPATAAVGQWPFVKGR